MRIIKKICGLLALASIFFAVPSFAFSDAVLDNYDGRFRDSLSYLDGQGVFTKNSYPEVFASNHVNRATFLKIVLSSYFKKYGVVDFQKEAQCFYEGNDPEEKFWSDYGFKDVKGDEWYAPYACYAKNKSIINGAAGYLLPHQDIKLEEAAKIVVNTQLLFEGKPSLERGALAWFQPYVEYLGERRALPDGLSAIGDRVWAGELAEMIYRLQEGIMDKKSAIVFTAQMRDGSLEHSWWYSVDADGQLYFDDRPLGVDIDSFEYLGASSGSVGDVFYIQDEAFDFIDVDSFEILDFDYIQDKNDVYMFDGWMGIELHPLEVKDLESFYVCSRDYAEDKYSGYLLGVTVGKGTRECDIPQAGIIEGGLSFPSHGIPAMKICAKNLDTGAEFCSNEHIESGKYYYGKGYQIKSVPPGKYTVSAELTGVPSEEVLTGGYTEHVVCMRDNKLSKQCPDHEPIVIELRRGDHFQNVDPWDWR